MVLGSCDDGRVLEYDQFRYEFYLNGSYAPLSVVRTLDARGVIRWRALEQRDWMLRIDAADLEACRQRAIDQLAAGAGQELSPEQQVLADAARDDGVLAGKLVDADPALVQAVADELERRGFGAKAAGDAGGGGNPLASMDLPRGMEALGQMERAQGDKRDMTRQERRLMKRILKNDDKAKAKREKEQARAAAIQAEAESADAPPSIEAEGAD